MAKLAQLLAKHLTPWFEKNHRDLEWRKTRDPYAIWVSEIMLQQTRVDTVRSYYSAFLARFPDVNRLATADEEQVLESWSGLGYYRRAKLLHQGAQYIAKVHQGRLPKQPTELRQIPGIGPYTAGAIASIAFDQPAALVDGNVARVLSRILAIQEPNKQGAQAPHHWQLVQEILEAGSPRILSQALMELGAIVCTPLRPKCSECPVRAHCQAYQQNLVEVIPTPKAKTLQPTEQLWAVAVQHEERVLLVRRPQTGLLASMWCLPLVPRKHARFSGKSLVNVLKEEYRIASKHARKSDAEPVKHVFSHRIWQLWLCTVEPDSLLDRDHQGSEHQQWIRKGERPRGGTPQVTEKLLVRIGY